MCRGRTRLAYRTIGRGDLVLAAKVQVGNQIIGYFGFPAKLVSEQDGAVNRVDRELGAEPSDFERQSSEVDRNDDDQLGLEFVSARFGGVPICYRRTVP